MDTKNEVRTWSISALDVLRKDAAYRLLVDLPGVVKDAVSLTVDQGVLTLVARRADQPEAGFRRRVSLGDGVDLEQVDAELKDGVLAVTIVPAALPKARQVEIRA